MAIYNVSDLDVTVSQENNFLRKLGSVSPSVVQDKLVSSLGSDSFKTVLSVDSKKDESAVLKATPQRTNQSEGRNVPLAESDVERDYRQKSEKAAPGARLTINSHLPKGMASPVGNSGATSTVMKDSLIIMPSLDVDSAALAKEDVAEVMNSFEFNPDLAQQFSFVSEDSMNNALLMPVGFSESIVAQNTIKQVSPDHEGMTKVEQNTVSLLNGNDVQVSLVSERTASTMQLDQRLDPAILRNMLTDQQLGTPKIIVSTTTPIQTIVPLITPMLISYDDSMSKGVLGVESDIGLNIEGVTGKPNSFVEASQHQKQLLSKNDDEWSEDGSEKSFDGADGQQAKVSTGATDLVQKTEAVKKLTQVIRDRAQDAIDKGKNDIALNVKGIQTNFGEVELDFKITNKKISVRFLSDSKDMQTLLNQERSNIVSILNGLIKLNSDAEYMLADMPVEICHKEKEI